MLLSPHERTKRPTAAARGVCLTHENKSCFSSRYEQAMQRNPLCATDGTVVHADYASRERGQARNENGFFCVSRVSEGVSQTSCSIASFLRDTRKERSGEMHHSTLLIRAHFIPRADVIPFRHDSAIGRPSVRIPSGASRTTAVDAITSAACCCVLSALLTGGADGLRRICLLHAGVSAHCWSCSF